MIRLSDLITVSLPVAIPHQPLTALPVLLGKVQSFLMLFALESEEQTQAKLPKVM